MEFTLGTIIILGIIYILIDKIKLNTKTKSEPEKKLMQYPYRKKYLLTKAEYVFYRILKNKCDEKDILICPKVRLEDYIQVTAKKQYQKYRGYIKSRHIDFLLCDSSLNIKAAIELDDNSHRQEKTKKTDDFKNNLFTVIEIPLHRIRMSDGLYEASIDRILESLP